MAIKLEKGHGKDGSPNHPYVHAHPTNYNWRDDIERLTHRLVNREAFIRRIWINTYHHHPPGGPDDFWRHRDTTSFDVWGFDGRGTRCPGSSGTGCIMFCSMTRAPGHLVDNLAGRRPCTLPTSRCGCAPICLQRMSRQI